MILEKGHICFIMLPGNDFLGVSFHGGGLLVKQSPWQKCAAGFLTSGFGIHDLINPDSAKKDSLIAFLPLQIASAGPPEDQLLVKQTPDQVPC